MKHLQKSLSLFLCIVMCLSFFPFSSAYAEEAESIEEESVLAEDELEQSSLQDNNSPEERDELPHEHSYTAEVTEPTCTEQGFTTYICDCGDSYVDDYTDALNHPEIIDVPEVPATETETGTTEGKKCTVCGQVLEGCEEILIQELEPVSKAQAENEDSLPTEEPVITIEKQPEDSAIVDGRAEFSVVASVNKDIELQYQWQRLNVNIEYADEVERENAWEDLENETDSKLLLDCLDGESLALNALYLYRCVLSTDNVSLITDEAAIRDSVDELIPEEPTEELKGAVAHSGTWGDLDWTLDDVGTLTISGTGAMNNMSSESPEAWRGWACRNKIKKVVLEDGITCIGTYAFYGCSSLTSITIPDSITSIGMCAFQNCSSLTSITIPEGETIISTQAFYGCSSLTSITIPNSVTSIYYGAFYGCSSLTSITIPDSITSIGMCAFQNCSSLTSITIPNSVTSIYDSAFSGCTSLTSISIPEGVTSIGSYAFSYCYALTSISIPDGVTSIGESTFYDCYSLTSIAIPEGITSIGDYAFYCCSSLTNITIPDGVTSIDKKTFYNCSSLTSIRISESVTSIGDYAFYGCSALVSITIPEGVESIGYYVFSGCDALTSISIPNSLKSIHYNAFDGCKFKTAGPIGSGCDYEFGWVTTIPTYAFSGCSALTSITIPEGVTSIGSYAFSYCYALTSISIPDGVTSIGSSAFSGCSALTSITIPEGVTSISKNTFDGCSSLTSIRIPVSVTSIGEYAFYACNSLSKVYYDGAMPQWNAITIKSQGNENLTNAEIDVKPPMAPQNLRVSNNTNNALTLSWLTANWVSGYEIQYSETSNFSSVKTVSINNAATNSTVIKDLIKGTTYYLRIRSFLSLSGEKYWSSWSESASALIQIGEKYIVSYYANGGTGAPENQSKDHGVTLKLSEKRPHRDGYTFVGWAESQFATAAKYQPGDQYIANNSVTLYAVWSSLVTEYVERCYQVILGREGEPEGVKYWTNSLQSGERAGAEIVSGFVNSQEFLKQGNSFEQAVIILYQAMLGREPDHDGKVYWVGELNKGFSYNRIINGFSGSKEFGKICAEYSIQAGSVDLEWRDRNEGVTAFVIRNYRYALGRNGDIDGLNYWCEQIITGQQAPKQCAKNFVFSTECVNKGLSDTDFVKMLYNLYMGREADQAGLNYWIDQLSHRSMTRQQVADSFAASQEFKSIIRSYGITDNTPDVPTYVISYDANGGTDAPYSQIKTHGVPLILSETKPINKSYVFSGWAEGSSSTSVKYHPGNQFTTDASITLYAVWTPDTTDADGDGWWRPSATNSINSQLNSPRDWNRSGYSKALLAVLLYNDLPTRFKSIKYRNALDQGDVYVSRSNSLGGELTYSLVYFTGNYSDYVLDITYYAETGRAVALELPNLGRSYYSSHYDYKLTSNDVDNVYDDLGM